MAGSNATELQGTRREVDGSRAARRLRRAGNVPGIVYGGNDDPIPFAVNSRELRLALAQGGAVLDLKLDGAAGQPVVLKELIRHPVSGETTHIDLVRVRLDVKIQAQVTLELTGVDDAPGSKEGGTLEQPTRELTVEALPTDIPDSLHHDVSEMQIGDTLLLESIAAPAGVEIIGEADTLIATLSAPRLQTEEDTEIEEETEVVGEGEGGDAEAEGGDDTADGGSDSDSGE
jgi:large subunit ribosomal protein L25